MTIVLWHTSDWHVNNKLGVRIPYMEMDKQDETRSSPGQRFLWRSLLDQQEIVKSKAEQYKAEVWVVFGGDMCELDIKDRTIAKHTSNTKTIEEMTINTMAPVLEIAKHIFMCAGTEAHVGQSQTSEDRIAKDIKAELVPGTKKQRLAHQWLIDVEGKKFLIQHHGKLGKLPWTRANALNQKATRLMLQWGRNLPDVFIQAHNHVFDTASKAYPIMVIAAPGMCLPTEHEYRMDADAAKIGGLYFVCQQGKILEWDAMLYQPDGLKLWSK